MLTHELMDTHMFCTFPLHFTVSFGIISEFVEDKELNACLLHSSDIVASGSLLLLLAGGHFSNTHTVTCTHTHIYRRYVA